MTANRRSHRDRGAHPRGGRTRLAGLAALALGVVALALGACGGGEGEDVIRKGSGYQVTLPDRWRDLTGRLKPELTSDAVPEDLALGNVSDLPGTGASVAKAPARLSLRGYMNAVRREPALGLRQAPRRTRLDGVEAIDYELETRSSGGLRVRQRHVLVVRDRTLYVIVFSARAHRFADNTDDFDTIFASWRWT